MYFLTTATLGHRSSALFSFLEKLVAFIKNKMALYRMPILVTFVELTFKCIPVTFSQYWHFCHSWICVTLERIILFVEDKVICVIKTAFYMVWESSFQINYGIRDIMWNNGEQFRVIQFPNHKLDISENWVF